MTKPATAISGLPRVATIATMASRAETFKLVLPAIHAQVDQVFVYLDGYGALPSFLNDFARVSAFRAEEVGDLHCSSRFLCLRDLAVPTVVVPVDDDIGYPPDYVDRLVGALEQVEGKAVVGVHGRVFMPPHRSYVHDATAFQFAQELVQSRHVHEGRGDQRLCFGPSRLGSEGLGSHRYGRHCRRHGSTAARPSEDHCGPASQLDEGSGHAPARQPVAQDPEGRRRAAPANARPSCPLRLNGLWRRNLPDDLVEACRHP